MALTSDGRERARAVQEPRWLSLSFGSGLMEVSVPVLTTCGGLMAGVDLFLS